MPKQPGGHRPTAPEVEPNPLHDARLASLLLALNDLASTLGMHPGSTRSPDTEVVEQARFVVEQWHATRDAVCGGHGGAPAYRWACTECGATGDGLPTVCSSCGVSSMNYSNASSEPSFIHRRFLETASALGVAPEVLRRELLARARESWAEHVDRTTAMHASRDSIGREVHDVEGRYEQPAPQITDKDLEQVAMASLADWLICQDEYAKDGAGLPLSEWNDPANGVGFDWGLHG